MFYRLKWTKWGKELTLRVRVSLGILSEAWALVSPNVWPHMEMSSKTNLRDKRSRLTAWSRSRLFDSHRILKQIPDFTHRIQSSFAIDSFTVVHIHTHTHTSFPRITSSIYVPSTFSFTECSFPVKIFLVNMPEAYKFCPTPSHVRGFSHTLPSAADTGCVHKIHIAMSW